jgi:hypothetical protein
MITALLFAASFAGCGSERVLVKNLLDAPELIAPQPPTVEQLISLKPPRWFRSAPRHRLEGLVVQLEVEVLAFKNELDGDIHAIIRGGAGNGWSLNSQTQSVLSVRRKRPPWKLRGRRSCD